MFLVKYEETTVLQILSFRASVNFIVQQHLSSISSSTLLIFTAVYCRSTQQSVAISKEMTETVFCGSSEGLVFDSECRKLHANECTLLQKTASGCMCVCVLFTPSFFF